MAADKECLTLVLATLAFFAFFDAAFASDPTILSDFILPGGVSASSEFFTYIGLRSAIAGDPTPQPFQLTKASMEEFPALNGQSVSLAVLQFGPGAINPLHVHPRSPELLVVVEGSLTVGFVDSSNHPFNQTLYRGDVFLFPQGLVHFQYNIDTNYKAVAVSAFSSANAGLVKMPKALFASGIDVNVLAKSFNVDSDTIQKLVSANTMG